MALDEQDLSEDLLWGEDAAASGSEAEPSEGSEDPGGSGEPPVHAAAAVGSRGKQKGLDIAGARTHAIHHNDACFWQPQIGHCGCVGYACSGAENRTRSVHFAGASSASHQSSTLRSSLDDLDAAGPTPSPPVDVPGGGLRRAAASNQPLQFGKAQQQQPYTRLVSLVSVKL